MQGQIRGHKGDMNGNKGKCKDMQGQEVENDRKVRRNADKITGK